MIEIPLWLGGGMLGPSMPSLFRLASSEEMKTGFGRGNLIGNGTRPLGREFTKRLRIHKRCATGKSTPQSSTIVSGATISFQTANVCETITPVTDAPTEKPA